ncbi:PHD and RING finger domain-containing protein 1 [Linum perenne]
MTTQTSPTASGSASPSSGSFAPSPNKRLKTLHSDETNDAESGFDPKGKQPMPATDGQDSSICCGICWSDYGTSIGGSIDSCNHYFCFVCIMEWAKIESRCPMCKRRFTAICRPPKEGVFATERVVRVPERNQVRGLSNRSFDPLANVECTVCHGSHDESLLLLCDLCDSASHTFCVGLGSTVPEGDWFCSDCSVSRTEHGSIESDLKLADEPRVSIRDATDCHDEPSNQEVVPGDSVVSIHDIVRDEEGCLGRRHSGAGDRKDETESSRSNSRGEGRNQRVADSETGNGARTLRRCRDLRACISSLRENWEELRTGSLSFSSALIESDSPADARRTSSSAVVVRNRNSLPSSSGQKPVLSNDFPGSTGGSREALSDSIDKAWEMMHRAKSMQLARQRSTNMQQGSKCPPRVVNGTPKEVGNRNSSTHLLKIHQLGTKQCSRSATPERIGKQVPSTTQKRIEIVRKECRRPIYNDPAVSSSGLQTSTSSDIVRENQHRLSSHQRITSASTSHVNEQKGSTRLSTSDAALPKTSQSTPTKAGAASNANRHKAFSVSNIEQYEEAKREIQSLVKQNLKLLSRDKHLGVEKFKEVARVSTHTILAECGLEHSKRAVISVPSPECNHDEQKMEDCSKGSLMGKCCRECFQGFVKKVVNLVLLS